MKMDLLLPNPHDTRMKNTEWSSIFFRGPVTPALHLSQNRALGMISEQKTFLVFIIKGESVCESLGWESTSYPADSPTTTEWSLSLCG